MSYTVPHRIETERLVIRRYTHADAPALADVTTRNADHLRRYMEWVKFEPQSAQQRREYIDRTHKEFEAGEDFTMGIFDRAGQFIGGTGFHVRYDPRRLEIGYWIDADHQGKGLITEVAAALTHVGLELTGASIIDIAHAPSNARSASIPQRLGFVRQDEPAHECFDDGHMVNGVMWWATWDHLKRDPLSAFPRPRAFGGAGHEIPWPN